MRADSEWTAGDVRSFMEEHRISSAGDLSKALGISRNRAYDIMRGKAAVPRTLALAMIGWSANALGGKVWTPPKHR